MHTIVACMKDEGLFIPEWVAFHRAIGFEKIIVFTNDCADNTVPLLKALEAAGAATHVPNLAEPGETYQAAALRQAMARPDVLASDWVLHIDVDEFLVIDLPDDSVQGLTEFGANSDVIALLWRTFGDQGYRRFNGGLIHERFVHCQDKIRPAIAAHKSIFRPSAFRRAAPHMPKDPIAGRKVRAINSAGQRMPPRFVINDGVRWKVGTDLLTWANARVHHYAVKSEDLLLLKGQRGRSNGAGGLEKYAVDSTYHRRHNSNQTTSFDAMRYSERFHREYERLLALPGVAAAMVKNWRWFKEQRALIDTLRQQAD